MKIKAAICAAVLLPVLALAQPKDISSERQKLAAEATKERLAFAHSKNYNPYDTAIRDARAAIWKLIGQKSCREAVELADKTLVTWPVDIEVLMGKAAALKELGDKRADQTMAKWIALADSILTSGDGKSFGTAFQVISVDEEYAALRLMRLQCTTQTLRSDRGGMYDVLTVHPKDSDKTMDLYFNVTLPMRHLDTVFGEKPKK